MCQQAQNVAACMAAHGYRAYLTYQPANRFWAFQGIETGISGTRRHPARRHVLGAPAAGRITRPATGSLLRTVEQLRKARPGATPPHWLRLATHWARTAVEDQLQPADSQRSRSVQERMTGIEPAHSAWESEPSGAVCSPDLGRSRSAEPP